jgi:hypothetical protein
VNRALLLRLVAAALVFVGISVLFAAYFFDPAVPRFAVEVAVWTALGLSAGLMATSWRSLLLGVPAGIAVYQHVALEAAFFAALVVGVATLLLLGLGTAIGKRSSYGRRIGVALLSLCFLALPYGVFRHVRPYNVTPAFAVPFDLDLGSAGEVHLDESVDDVRAALGPPDAVEDGVFSRDGLTVWHADGVVVAVEAEDERFQTVDGVGVGDSLAYARQRWPGLVCGRDGFREPYCAGFAGLNLLLVEGNPIRSLTVSSDRCWPDLEGLWPPGADTCEEGIRVLRPVRPQLG